MSKHNTLTYMKTLLLCCFMISLLCACGNEQVDPITKENTPVVNSSEVDKSGLSDLLYRKLEFNIGRAYTKEELSFHKCELVLKTNNPQKIIVVYNDEYLEEIAISEDVIKYEIKIPGWYGFYVEDEQGAFYDINEITYITCNNIKEESTHEKENE